MIDRLMWRLTFNFARKLGGFAILFMLLVHAQEVDDQSGFISIDCGLADNSSYTERTTSINYISDARFIDTGERHLVLPEYRDLYQQPYESLRSFPRGRRNCYRINVISGTKYLIRASFLYGNYEGQNKLPEFQLHLGPNLWDTVRFENVSKSTNKELIHYVPVVKNYIHVCLVNTGFGVPFISALELRPLPMSTYPEQPENSLALIMRFDTGSSKGYRYPYDGLDRFWYGYNPSFWSQINTTDLNAMISSDRSYQPPSTVMRSAAIPKDRSHSLDISWMNVDRNAKYYTYLHFAEVEKLPPNQSRLQYISKDGELFQEAFAPSYLETKTIEWSGITTHHNTSISILKADASTLPPILNAVEVYMVKEFSVSETNQQDVDPITDIKSTYKIERNWQGDPCVPKDYLWEGVSCSYHENEHPRIISLNLSSSGLTGEIPPIFNLTMIETLDLSNNNLTGSVPQFFSQLPKLTTLNLEKNNFTGSIPDGLNQRRKHGLSLSLCENPNLSEQVSCEKKKHNINIIPVAGSSFGIFILLSTVAALLWGFNRKRKQAMIKNSIPNWSVETEEGQHFTYSELVKITNNFASIIGSGGYGKVYHGTLKDGIQVAVKLLTSSSGSKEFQNEVKLLMRAHHRNLVSLIGNCHEGDTMALVFEYVTNGNLQQHMSATAEIVLTWNERIQIAVDAARGLDYLHNGCKPPIVHRDLKTSNILLNEKMQAKICDFGISKVLSTESATHTLTDHIRGTRGYFDPEYYTTGNLNKKSDIYSFGIVLLELITGKPAIITDIKAESIHICQWAWPKFERMEIESIVDSRIQGTYGNSSAWKAIEIAMACVASTTIQRPDIVVVYNELKECLEIEVPLEITKMPEIEESDDDSTTYPSGSSIHIMSHIDSETERLNSH